MPVNASSHLFIPLPRPCYLLLLKVLPPVAEGAGTSFLATCFFAAAAVIPVALLTAFLITPGFFTIVVWLLESLFKLLWLAARPRPDFAGSGGGAIAPAAFGRPRTLPAAVALDVVREDAFDPGALFSRSDCEPLTRLASDAVAAATVPGLIGETGLASPDLPGDILTGD